jgi:hypothetical protein
MEQASYSFARNIRPPMRIADNSALKKTRRLRKNFDILAKALKNASTSKKEKSITFSSDL